VELLSLGFPMLSAYSIFTKLVILTFKSILLHEKKVNAPTIETLTFLTSLAALLDLCSVKLSYNY